MKRRYIISACASIFLKPMNIQIPMISRKHHFFCLLLLGLIIIIAYSRTFQVPFVFDDFHSIVDKSRIRDFFSFLSPNALTYPRPLTDLTFALNYRIGGLEILGFHIVNTLIHIFNAWLVYMISMVLFTRLGSNDLLSEDKKSSEGSNFPIIAAFAAALFFALHPMQTQAVTYIVQRYTSLSAFFSLLCIWLFLQARLRMEETNQPCQSKIFDPVVILFMCTSLVCAVSAFLSKQTAAMLPGLIILLELILFKKSLFARKRAALTIIPILFLFIFFVAYSSGALRGEISLSSLLEDVGVKTMETRDISRWTYLITQFSVIVLYIRMIVLPYGQNIDHMYPFTEYFWNVQTLFSIGLILGIIVLAFYAYRKKPLITLAVGWFFIALSVESSIIPIRDAMFEHRMYLPMFGPALIFGLMIFYAAEKINKKAFVWLLAGCLILILGITTVVRNEVWRDPVKLWKDSIQKNPYNFRAWTNLGQVQLAKNDIPAAEKSFRYSLKLRSQNSQAMGNLGIALARQGKFKEAIPYLKRALETMPESFDFHYNLGVTYGVSGKYDEAIEHYRKALKIRPDHLLSLMNLSVELGRINSFDEAEKVLSRALEISPDNVDLLINLGIIQFNLGHHDDALEKMLRAEKIKPDSSEIMTNLGIIHYRMGNSKEALQYLGKAVQLDPANSNAKAYATQILKDMQSRALKNLRSPGAEND